MSAANKQIQPADITAIILAGGKSSRMEGQDKGLLLLQGKTMTQWVIDSISSKVGSIIISANRNLKNYRDFGYSVVSDSLADYQGPLAGIAACLTQVKTKYALVVPVDTPILPSDLVERLANELNESKTDLAVVQLNKRIQPAHLLFRSSLVNNLESYLQSGQRRMQEWVGTQNHVTVSFDSDGNHFENVNSETELNYLNGHKENNFPK